jgi:hypothetical protein
MIIIVMTLKGRNAMTAIALEATRGDAGTGRGRAALALETAGVLALFAGSLALFSADRIVEGGLLAHAWPVLRMGAVLLLLTWLLKRRGESWAELGLRRPQSRRRAALATIGGYFGILAFVALLVLPALAAAGTPNGAPHGFEGLRGNGVELAYWIAVSWLVAGFGEELLARGWLTNRLEQIFGPGRSATAFALVGQAVLFGAAHAWNGIAGVVVAGAVGFGLGLVWLMGGRNLWPAIVIHGLIDSQSFTALYLGVMPSA